MNIIDDSEIFKKEHELNKNKNKNKPIIKPDIIENNIEIKPEIKENSIEIKENSIEIKENSIEIINFTLEEIFVNLRLLSKIEDGDKLYQTGNYINIDNSFLQSITRKYYGLDRKKIIVFINLVINKSFVFIDNIIKSNNTNLLFRLKSDLKNSIPGLRNVKNTYGNDKLVQAEIDIIIDNIETKLNEE